MTLFCIFNINLVCARFNVTCRLLWWCFYVFRADISCFLSRFHRICFKFLLDLQSKKFFLLFSRFERFKKLCVNKHVKLKSCLSHLTVQHLTSDLCFLSVCEVGDRLDRRRRVSRGITVFISECLREKALNQTGRVTLTLNGRKRERERSIGLN